MRKKGGICFLNPFQAGDSGAEVRVEAAHGSQSSRLSTCSSCLFTLFNEECVEMMGSGKVVCRPAVKVIQQA